MNSRRLIAGPKAYGKALSSSALNVGAPQDTCGRRSPEKQDEFASAHRVRRLLSNDRVGNTAKFTTHLARLCELDHIGLKGGGAAKSGSKGPFRIINGRVVSADSPSIVPEPPTAHGARLTFSSAVTRKRFAHFSMAFLPTVINDHRVSDLGSRCIMSIASNKSTQWSFGIAAAIN
jgi:hypothetical protein